jgi:glutamate racemase
MTLARRISTITARMDVDRVIVACNAASAVLDAVESDLPMEGVIRHGVSAALADEGQNIGIVGGRRTIEEQVYGGPLRAAGRSVIECIAQPMSAHIEAGRLDGPRVEADLKKIMGPLKGVDALVLACTHYPAMKSAFASHVPSAQVIDPMDTLVQTMIREWQLERVVGSGRLDVGTTGSVEQMKSSARGAFGIELPFIRALEF